MRSQHIKETHFSPTPLHPHTPTPLCSLGTPHGRRTTRYEWNKHPHSPSSPTPHSLLPTPHSLLPTPVFLRNNKLFLTGKYKIRYDENLLKLRPQTASNAVTHANNTAAHT
ncbi:MAG: hypothetical protein DSM106950_38420 [Stigonema ocellatum SAG 48.90 = DSM 106950]|nr:hypothetical protein [Stigonema ocellatum SAG 48.90 = DSM 106950]